MLSLRKAVSINFLTLSWGLLAIVFPGLWYFLSPGRGDIVHDFYLRVMNDFFSSSTSPYPASLVLLVVGGFFCIAPPLFVFLLKQSVLPRITEGCTNVFWLQKNLFLCVEDGGVFHFFPCERLCSIERLGAVLIVTYKKNNSKKTIRREFKLRGRINMQDAANLIQEGRREYKRRKIN